MLEIFALFETFMWLSTAVVFLYLLVGHLTVVYVFGPTRRTTVFDWLWGTLGWPVLYAVFFIGEGVKGGIAAHRDWQRGRYIREKDVTFVDTLPAGEEVP